MVQRELGLVCALSPLAIPRRRLNASWCEDDGPVGCHNLEFEAAFELRHKRLRERAHGSFIGPQERMYRVEGRRSWVELRDVSHHFFDVFVCTGEQSTQSCNEVNASIEQEAALMNGVLAPKFPLAR